MPFLTLFILKQGSLNAVCSSRTRFLPLHIPGFLLNLFKKSLQGKGWVTEAATVALIFEPYEFVPAQHHGTVPCWNLKLSGIGCFEDEWEEGLWLLITYLCIELVPKAFLKSQTVEWLSSGALLGSSLLYILFTLSHLQGIVKAAWELTLILRSRSRSHFFLKYKLCFQAESLIQICIWAVSRTNVILVWQKALYPHFQVPYIASRTCSHHPLPETIRNDTKCIWWMPEMLCLVGSLWHVLERNLNLSFLIRTLCELGRRIATSSRPT